MNLCLVMAAAWGPGPAHLMGAYVVDGSKKGRRLFKIQDKLSCIVQFSDNTAPLIRNDYSCALELKNSNIDIKCGGINSMQLVHEGTNRI